MSLGFSYEYRNGTPTVTHVEHGGAADTVGLKVSSGRRYDGHGQVQRGGSCVAAAGPPMKRGKGIGREMRVAAAAGDRGSGSG
eukprot:764956-Hanusia_phi.AAC.1